MNTIGIVGLGFMGSSLAKAMAKADPSLHFLALEKRPEAISAASATIAVEQFSGSLSSLASKSDLVILALKPQDLPALLGSQGSGESILSGVTTPILSVLAGTSLAVLGAALPQAPIARLMPNLAIEYGKAASGLAFDGRWIGLEDQRTRLVELLQPGGTLIEMPEHLISAIIGISGSGIAFALKFARALALGGVRQGIRYDQSLAAVADVLEGAAAMIRSGTDPEAGIAQVCSPGGTTIRGIKALEDGAFASTVMNAVQAAAERNAELEAR